MSRAPRIEFEGAHYHVLTRGDRREAIFLDDKDRLKFLEWDLSGMSHREISDLFGTPSSNSVAQMIRRTKEKENPVLKILRGKRSHK